MTTHDLIPNNALLLVIPTKTKQNETIRWTNQQSNTPLLRIIILVTQQYYSDTVLI